MITPQNFRKSAHKIHICAVTVIVTSNSNSTHEKNKNKKKIKSPNKMKRNNSAQHGTSSYNSSFNLCVRFQANASETLVGIQENDDFKTNYPLATSFNRGIQVSSLLFFRTPFHWCARFDSFWLFIRFSGLFFSSFVSPALCIVRIKFIVRSFTYENMKKNINRSILMM